MATNKNTLNPNLIFGRVTDAQNRPLPLLLVYAYDRDMRSEELLGEAVTERDGKYEIQWAAGQPDTRGKRTADIALKVLTRERQTLLYASGMDDIRFNAGPLEEINVVIRQVIQPEVVEYDYILREVGFLRGEVAVEDLQENEQHRDITFLSKEAEIVFEKIEHLVVAHRLQAMSKIEAAFFYALLRKNTLLKTDRSQFARVRLRIGLESDTRALLFEAAMADPRTLIQDVKAAAKVNIVSAQVAKNAMQSAAKLERYRAEAAAFFEEEQPRVILDRLGRFVQADKLGEMGRLFRENPRDLGGFIEKINAEGFFPSEGEAADAKLTALLGEWLGFDEQLLADVKTKQKIEKPTDLRRLAAMNKADWKAALSGSAKSGRSVPREKMDAKLIDFRASVLVRKMEKAFPTAAFTAQLGREKRTVLQNQSGIADFLQKHEDYDLRHSNTDLFLKSKKMASPIDEALREELKSVQRVFKLVPHYGKTLALRAQKIHSAQSIVAAGERRFVGQIAPEAGIPKREAREIFRKAERTHTAAMLIVGELQDSIRAMDVAAIGTPALARTLEKVGGDFPNLKTLFNLADACACEHCRSVYGPAAYLVEILQFLDNRVAGPGVRFKDVLFKRRPDLRDIDLSCENANTPLPYIDLVCELLEAEVAPDTGILFPGSLFSDDISTLPNPLVGTIAPAFQAVLAGAGLPVSLDALIYSTEKPGGAMPAAPFYLRDKKVVCRIEENFPGNYTVFRLRQTLSTAEELAAAPEYVNTAAYDILKNQSFAFKLPFDLFHTEAKAYLERFGLERAKLMEDFDNGGIPNIIETAAEKLGLTDAEHNLVVTPLPTESAQQAIWNVPENDPLVAGKLLDFMKRLDHFLDKTGLSYREADLLLSLPFIDMGNPLFIKHLTDLECDTADKEVANLDFTALDKIHRFLRCQQKSGWGLETLNEIVMQGRLGASALDDACLFRAANLRRVAEETGIPVEELTGFYGEIPVVERPASDKKPLYHRIFLNKAKNGFVEELLLPENIDGVTLIGDPALSLKTSIAVCLQTPETELDKLLPFTPSGGTLRYDNLSFLFGATRLMRKLKLKADEFIALRELTGIAFEQTPEDTLAFVRAAKAAAELPLKLADLKFMLWHKAENLSYREISDASIQAILVKLQAEYQKAFLATKSPFDPNLSADTQKESLQKLLSPIEGMSEEDVIKMIGFVDRIWLSVADAKTFVDDKLGQFFDNQLVKDALDDLDAVPAGTDFSQESNIFIEELMSGIAAFQFENAKKTALVQNITTAFKADADLVNIVLQHARLRQGTGDLLMKLLLSDSTLAATETNFPDQYQSLRLLHKLLPFIQSFKLENNAIDWFFRNNAALGWFGLDTIPYQDLQAPEDYGKFLAFARMVARSKTLAPVVNPADAANPVSFFSVMELLLSGLSTEFLEKLALLLGYDVADVTAVDMYFSLGGSLVNYSLADNWARVETCLAHLRQMGCSMAQMFTFIRPVLTSNETNALRALLKSRYDEETWLGTLEEITDAIRPQKRNALVAYLLATNPDMKNENDLYDYFLVDVEMEACMPSSRIVQAHGTVQLFAQRCLMGLEPEAIADKDDDPAWEQQWKWMRNYRVWEANRKIFLYPENWIEAELRDDKSYLFSELENELLQNELTDLTAGDALINYLEKLDGIAFLEVMATWYQSDIRTMHVFARTKGGDPGVYFYRRFEQERYWTAWEKVELDITGDHLLAFVRNDRLTLAWPVFSEEADPGQKATIPASDAGSVDMDKPNRKLNIQIAISEYASRTKTWRPKKISKDGILTPTNFTNNAEDLRRDKYNLMYIEASEQVLLFYSESPERDYEYHRISGLFDITGCKGYPELAPINYETLRFLFPDFLPDFWDTHLKSQRYNEINPASQDQLAVRNGVSFIQFLELLAKTPGNYRLTYPHQFTSIDWVSLLFQYLVFYSNSPAGATHNRKFKYPLGTMLPYFKEDSYHAYVIIPGFYQKQKQGANMPRSILTDEEKRTASNVMQLIEDAIFWYEKFIGDYGQDVNRLVADESYQAFVAEVQKYAALGYGEQFKNMYHPLVCSLRKTLYRDGIPALMQRETQLQQTPFNFQTHYQPGRYVPLPYPVENIDFESDGSYSLYNWELFFHVPLLIATRLTKNQRFEEAMTWFHYMFNPTGALPGIVPQKFWVTKPFFEFQAADYLSQRIDKLLRRIAEPTSTDIAELEFAILQWRIKPFRPHVVARFRPVAYQKAVLMKYLDNLIAWGDYLFRQDTMESIVQATQMYVLADKLLGERPRTVPPIVKPPYETYNQIEAKLDAFGNALIDLENILPEFSALPEGGAELPPSPTLSMLYFCVPQNEKMLEYWDTVADRLFKIRHCQDINGVERSLALFAPPIDPAALVRAAAAGLSISDVLAGLNAPLPYYRFNVLSQKATELTNEVRSLGSSLLQTLEKKDGEAMALLRSELEIKVLNAVRDMKKLQISEAKEQIEVLKRTKQVTEERHKFYAQIQKINQNEQLNLDKLGESQNFQVAAQGVKLAASIISLLPDIDLGVSGFGGSPIAKFKIGGLNIGQATNAASDILSFLGMIASNAAARASILGGYDRRFEDWKLQERLAKKELASIEKQITAADIRKQIAENDLKNHDLQIENAKKTDEFMRTKYTNKELYEWMIGQISSVYFRSYQLAHDFAKKAERCYQFELGNDDTFISYGYWDTLKKGLQSADHLLHDIKRMETGYLDKNKREYELTKHVSLALLDPLALIKLRATGSCDFDIPEALFDMDYAGQYFRRIKSVSVSLPCVAGPYTSVSAKLSLVKNKYRKSLADPANYPEDPVAGDQRFVYNIGAIQSIATSNAQNDGGVFELNFRDERYLPFEGTGAISSWRLELPAKDLSQFNYDTISDVIVHLKYMAREGGSMLRTAAEVALKTQLNEIKQELSETGLHVAINLKHDMPNEWHLLKQHHSVDLKIDKSRLPYMAQLLNVAIDSVMFIAKAPSFKCSINGESNPPSFNSISGWSLLRRSTTAIDLDTSFNLSASQSDLTNLEEMILVVKYSF